MSDEKIQTVEEHIDALCAAGIESSDASASVVIRERDRALLLEGIRLGLAASASLAEKTEYPHPQDMLDKSGRGWFYQKNIKHAWIQAGHWVAKKLRNLDPADILAAHEKERDRG